jgi:hypothetical protein
MTTQSAPSYAPPGLPPDHPSGTKIQRDSWMLNDPKAGTGLDADQARYAGTFQVGTMPTLRDVTRTQGEDFTEDYGEGDVGGSKGGGGTFGGSSGGGGGDFFSGLGRERKRKEREEKPDPSNVRFSFFQISPCIFCLLTERGTSPRWRATSSTEVYSTLKVAGRQIRWSTVRI